MLLPDPKRLNDQLENKIQATYKCSDCEKEFQGNEMQSEALPDNMIIQGLLAKQRIPKCPHCGNLSFFGFEVVDIAF